MNLENLLFGSKRILSLHLVLMICISLSFSSRGLRNLKEISIMIAVTSDTVCFPKLS